MTLKQEIAKVKKGYGDNVEYIQELSGRGIEIMDWDGASGNDFMNGIFDILGIDGDSVEHQGGKVVVEWFSDGSTLYYRKFSWK